ncbi:unnamed protein product [Closterium sp. Yama58-4]|nr:unnamed protein product [Closterium sp. Yama58-4]
MSGDDQTTASMLRRVRVSYVDYGTKVQALTALCYPRFRNDLPLLAVELLCFNSSRLLAFIDLHPTSPHQLHRLTQGLLIPAPVTARLNTIRQQHAHLLTPMTARFFASDSHFFSPHLLLYRSQDGWSDANLLDGWADANLLVRRCIAVCVGVAGFSAVPSGLLRLAPSAALPLAGQPPSGSVWQLLTEYLAAYHDACMACYCQGTQAAGRADADCQGEAAGRSAPPAEADRCGAVEGQRAFDEYFERHDPAVTMLGQLFGEQVRLVGELFGEQVRVECSMALHITCVLGYHLGHSSELTFESSQKSTHHMRVDLPCGGIHPFDEYFERHDPAVNMLVQLYGEQVRLLCCRCWEEVRLYGEQVRLFLCCRCWEEVRLYGEQVRLFLCCRCWEEVRLYGEQVRLFLCCRCWEEVRLYGEQVRLFLCCRCWEEVRLYGEQVRLFLCCRCWDAQGLLGLCT